MHDAHEFLRSLTLVLCVAAVTTLVFQRLRQPVVFGYLMAGLIVGPHVPIPLVANEDMVRTLSELGVIFLMFSLGLEFSLGRLSRVAGTAGTVALLQTSVMMWLGYSTGRLLGWSSMDALFAGAAIGISSTTIIVKVFKEHRVQGAFTDLVFGILIAEDVIAILLITLLTAVSEGGAVSATQMAMTLGRLTAFLVALLVVGMLLVPRFVRFVVGLERPETTLVVCLGLCTAGAFLAQSLGYSVALGAFIVGSLVAESGEATRIERLVEPVRDMFAAVFFVSVGMLIDPALVAAQGPAVLLFTALVIVGNVTAVSVSTFLIGSGTRTAVQTGMSLAQIGEFSFIIASIGVASGAVSTFLYPVVVAVSALTTLTTPWLILSADRVAEGVDRRLPRPLQTFVALYGSWIESTRSRSESSAQKAAFRRTLRTLAIDAAVIVALGIGGALEAGSLGARLAARTGLSPAQARAAIVATAVLLSLPFVFGIVRTGRALGQRLAQQAFPGPAGGRLDLAAAPRRAMVATIQLATILVVCAPILAIVQPFVPAPAVMILLGVLLIVGGVAIWRTASNLQGHVRAAAEAIVDAIGRQSRPAAAGATSAALARAHGLLPGLGDPVPVEILAGHPAVGQRLGALRLRGRTDATIVAIVRDGPVVLLPDGHEVLRAGDVVAVAGTKPAIEAAVRLLSAAPAAVPDASRAAAEATSPSQGVEARRPSGRGRQT